MSSSTPSSAVGKTCPYCRTTIEPGAPAVICPQCGIPHHADCWQENGRCTTFGCQGGGPALSPMGGGPGQAFPFGQDRPCPACGFMMRPTETTCPYCRTPLFQPRATPYAPMRADGLPVRPHRGGTVLACGVMSFVPCCGALLGIVVWSMGNQDLSSMEAGVMDSDGRAQTEVGRILGIVSLCIHAAVALIYALATVANG